MQPDPRDSDARVDLTPMIDVVFLMIVFFVCIEFRVLEARLPAWLPRDRGSGPTYFEPAATIDLQIRVTAPGTPTWPTGAATSDRRPARYVLRGHEIAWQVGPVTVLDEAELRTQLVRLARAQELWHPDRADPSRLVPPGVVILPQRGVRYADVARTSDIARAAGFTDIDFGASPR